MNELISVIVPVFNVEKYIDRCIGSILAQTYKKLEIIIVDDGSNDSSGTIIDKYANEDNRIKVIHKSNGGLSDARNAGLSIATGSFLTFIDSDDYIEPNYIKNLLYALRNTGADISMCDLKLFYEHDNEAYDMEPSLELSEVVLDQEEAIKRALKMQLRQSAWAKLYRADLFSSIRFPKGKIYEDLAVFYRLLLESQRVVIINSKDYNYQIRAGSIMQSGFSEKQLVEIEIIDEEMDIVEKHYPKLKKLISGRRIYSYLLVIKRMSKCSERSKYKDQIKNIRRRTIEISRSLIMEKSIPLALKIKIISIRCGTPIFIFIQSIADKKTLK